MMNRLLARFAMSFFIIAAVLAWQCYEAMEQRAADWRVGMDLFAAAASVTLGVAGIRERHRRQP